MTSLVLSARQATQLSESQEAAARPRWTRGTPNGRRRQPMASISAPQRYRRALPGSGPSRTAAPGRQEPVSRRIRWSGENDKAAAQTSMKAVSGEATRRCRLLACSRTTPSDSPRLRIRPWLKDRSGQYVVTNSNGLDGENLFNLGDVAFVVTSGTPHHSRSSWTRQGQIG